MTKIAQINKSGLIKVVVFYALKDTEHELTTIYFYKKIVSETKGYDLIILGHNIEEWDDGWEIARKIQRRKSKVLVISNSIPPKKYLKIPWVDEDRLFNKEIDLKKVIDSLITKR